MKSKDNQNILISIHIEVDNKLIDLIDVQSKQTIQSDKEYRIMGLAKVDIQK